MSMESNIKRVAKFEKVSYEQFRKDADGIIGKLFDEDTIKEIYNGIKLPKRATVYSAGYDFYAPYPFKPTTNSGIIIPTGIRCQIEPGWVMKVYPRSGQGFKHGLHLYNTTGIIDGDYYNADNEGHIMMKISVKENDNFIVDRGVAFCQGIFSEYGITVDDDTSEIRTGGLGSTSK